MGDESKKECCSTGSGCCCKKAFFAGILIGVILISAGFGIALGTKCAVSGACPMKDMSMKMCPVSQSQVQK